jgi:hypothetical protein
MRSLERKKDAHISNLSELILKPVTTIPHRLYSNQSQDLVLLQLTFACRALSTVKVAILSDFLNQILTHIERTRVLISLIANAANLLPRDFAIGVRPDFFAFAPVAAPELLDQSARLSHYIEFRRAQFAAFQVPPCVSDFPGFFSELIRRSRESMDEELFYSPLLPGEADISRHFFCGGNPKLGAEVDRIVAAAADDPTGFLEKAALFAFSLIPDCARRTSEEQSLGLTIVIRVVFDRLYEKCKFGPPSALDEALLARIGAVPLRHFTLPQRVEWPEKSIRDYFSNDFLPGERNLFLTWIAFFTNPVDMLFAMHESLCLIHRAALMRMLRREELTQQELAQILGFDELFAFLIGVTLGSDVPEFFRIGGFLERFNLRDSLSNAFEYASAAIGALVSHFTLLNVEELEAGQESM